MVPMRGPEKYSKLNHLALIKAIDNGHKFLHKYFYACFTYYVHLHIQPNTNLGLLEN